MNKYAIAFYDNQDNVEMEIIFENTPKDALNKMLTLTSVSKEDIFEIVKVDKADGSILETIEINEMELSEIVRGGFSRGNRCTRYNVNPSIAIPTPPLHPQAKFDNA